MNDIIKAANADDTLPKKKPLPQFAKGKGKGRVKSVDITSLWTDEHTRNFELIKDLITKAPILHLPNNHGQFVVEIDSSSRFTACILYQTFGSEHKIVAYYSCVMPESASRYSSSEIELCGLAKCLKHWKHLLLYRDVVILMDHSALRSIYCSKKPPKTKRLLKFLEEISDFSITIQHVSGRKMFVSDFLSRYSDKSQQEGESMPYLTSTEFISGADYMNQLDKACKWDDQSKTGKCTHCIKEYHAFPLTRSQAKIQGVVIPELFEAQREKQKTTKFQLQPTTRLRSDRSKPVARENISPSGQKNSTDRPHSAGITPKPSVLESPQICTIPKAIVDDSRALPVDISTPDSTISDDTSGIVDNHEPLNTVSASSTEDGP